MRFLTFIAVLIGLIFYILFLFRTIWPNQAEISSLVAIGMMIISISWMFAARARRDLIQNPFMQIYIWMGSFLMGFLGTWVFLSLPVQALVFLINFLFSTSFNLSESVFVVSTVITVLGCYQALRGPLIKKVKIKAHGSVSQSRPFKIVQISDLHIGLTIGERYVRNVVEKINSLDADLVVITGDIADGTPESLKSRLGDLKKIKALSGICFVTGNHEYYSGAKMWIEFLKNLGFESLLNQNRVYSFENKKILVAGVPDFAGAQFFPDHQPDFNKARGEDFADYKILLCHQPEAYRLIEKMDFDLMLSGHTHAGQFFPFSLLVHFVHRFNRGLGRIGNLKIYVNQGTGYWGPAHRFLVPAEMTLIEIDSI